MVRYNEFLMKGTITTIKPGCLNCKYQHGATCDENSYKITYPNSLSTWVCDKWVDGDHDWFAPACFKRPIL